MSEQDLEREIHAGDAERWPDWLPLATLVVGLALTAALAIASAVQFRHNEQRLLNLRVRDVGSVFTAALPEIQTSLASAAELAAATNGNLRKFRGYAAPFAGTGPSHPFVSVSLWQRSRIARGPLTVLGAAPELSAAAAGPFFATAARESKLSVIGLLHAPTPRVGYAYAAQGPGGYVVYASSAIPANHKSPIQANSAFSGLDYALYLGRSQRPRDLLLTSVTHPPLRGRRASDVVPFGNTSLTLILSARHPLAGTLPQRLPWIIGIVGALVTLAFSAIAARLAARRRYAERLANENRRLYAEQRGIAQTLQHALLPQELPRIEGIEMGARYSPGVDGVDVGGDWYDVIPLGPDRVLLVVGDVSGRGLPAATTMAALRYAIRGYAAQHDAPATILTKLSDLVSVSRDGQLATVLCAVLDVDRREITVTSAGHLPPLVIDDGHADYIRSEVGLPVGVEAGEKYSSATVTVPPGATFLAFTDGLVERRDEPISESLRKLRDSALEERDDLAHLLDRLVRGSHSHAAEDDIAILGLRWPSSTQS
ncbi:MAG TPA: PP2C family protein-serine/threonine phosphatase [Solirubrobacteraceae bacterium]|nr:PP2C family protein-serine/threonine phosphatase [Solirubrobacteraceae bacterium]